MLGVRLPKAENQRICQASGLKTGRDRLKNLNSGRPTRELLEQYLTAKQNGYLQSGRLRRVIAYEKWSLRES